MKLKLLWALVICVMLTGCTAAVRNSRNGSDDDTAQALIRGNTREEVISVLGSPVKEEKIEIIAGHYIEFLFYPQVNQDGSINKDVLIPLGFKEDKLVSWQDSYYNSIKLAAQRKEKR